MHALAQPATTSPLPRAGVNRDRPRRAVTNGGTHGNDNTDGNGAVPPRARPDRRHRRSGERVLGRPHRPSRRELPDQWSDAGQPALLRYGAGHREAGRGRRQPRRRRAARGPGRRDRGRVRGDPRRRPARPVRRRPHPRRGRHVDQHEHQRGRRQSRAGAPRPAPGHLHIAAPARARESGAAPTTSTRPRSSSPSTDTSSPCSTRSPHCARPVPTRPSSSRASSRSAARSCRTPCP